MEGNCHESCFRPQQVAYSDQFCPSGHRLIEFLTEEDDWDCSNCERNFPMHTTLSGCRICDYDLCRPCCEKFSKIFGPTPTVSSSLEGSDESAALNKDDNCGAYFDKTNAHADTSHASAAGMPMPGAPSKSSGAAHLTNLLFRAVSVGHIQAIQLLLDARADVSHKTSEAHTVFSLAKSETVFDMLIKATERPEWTEEERKLYRGTRGQFNSDVELQSRCSVSPLKDSASPCKVSVICPTLRSRGGFHNQLYECFTSQTYTNKELIVVESGREPGGFFQSGVLATDQRVIYRFYKDEESDVRTCQGKISIGMKRNIAIRLAQGVIVAHFDDDDMYCPGYLQQMVNVMSKHGAHFLKLSSWFVFDHVSGRLAYCDPEVDRQYKESARVDELVYGYGFSYVYRRDLAVANPFPDQFLGEDYSFVRKLQLHRFSVCLWPDLDGLCLHRQHGLNTSDSFPGDYLSPDFFECLQISDTAAVQRIMAEQVRINSLRRDRVKNPKTPCLLHIVHALGALRRTCLARRHTGMPEVAQVLESGNFYESHDLATAFNKLKRSTLLHVAGDTNDCIQYEYELPWSCTVGEANACITRDFSCFRDEADSDWIGPTSQVRLLDAERILEDSQLLLSRQRLWFTVLKDKGVEVTSSRPVQEGVEVTSSRPCNTNRSRLVEKA